VSFMVGVRDQSQKSCHQYLIPLYTLLPPMRFLHQRLSLFVFLFSLFLCTRTESSLVRFTQGNDTYTFVPDSSDSQTLVVHRASGEIILNSKSFS